MPKNFWIRNPPVDIFYKAQNHTWRLETGSQEAILEYFCGLALPFDLRQSIVGLGPLGPGAQDFWKFTGYNHSPNHCSFDLTGIIHDPNHLSG